MMKRTFKGLLILLATAATFLVSDMAFAVQRGYNIYAKPGKRSTIFQNTRNRTFSYTGKKSKSGRYVQVSYIRNGRKRYAWMHKKGLTRSERRRGYSRSSDLANADFSIPENPVFNSKYHVRSRPSTGSRKLGKTRDKKYTMTNKVSPNGRWLEVTCPGCSKPRWIHINALQAGPKPPAPSSSFSSNNNGNSETTAAGAPGSQAPDSNEDDIQLSQIDATLPNHENTRPQYKHRIKGKMTTTANVNMREAPSTRTESLDTIPAGTVVDFFETDPKYGWQRVGYNGKVGYVHPKYIRKSSQVDKNVARNRRDAYKKVINIANKYNGCLNTRSVPNKVKRKLGLPRTKYGTPRTSLRRIIGYYHGSTVTFARSVCRSNSDPVKKAMLQGRNGRWKGKNRDILKLFSPGSKFLDRKAINVKLYGPVDGTEKNLISLYSLMLSKGLRESGGDYRDGIDINASNTRPQTTEAGLYQTSYNVHNSMTRTARKAALGILKKYRNNRHACMNDIFDKKKPRQRKYRRSTGRKGTAAREFQDLMRSCPAASAEHTSIAVRQVMQHYGPVRRKEALPFKKCVPMLEEVYDYIKTNPSICDSLAIVPKVPKTPEEDSPPDASLATAH